MKSIISPLLALSFIHSTISPNPVSAFQIDTTDTNIDEILNPPNNLGDYSVIGEFDQTTTGLGNINEVLVFTTGSTGTGTTNNTLSIETLLNTLSTPSPDHELITSASSLVFYIGVNETGQNQELFFQDITMTFEVPEFPNGTGTTQTITFALASDDDTVTQGTGKNPDIDNDPTLDIDIEATGGNNTSEIKIQLDFGFDLYETYGYTNSTNTGVANNYNYTISATAINEDGGNDRFFLSSGLTELALQQEVPFKFAPGMGFLIALGFVGIDLLRRRI